MESAIDRIKAKVQINGLLSDIKVATVRQSLNANRRIQSDRFGSTFLPLSNCVPKEFAQVSKMLPHTQVESQDLMAKNPKEFRPNINNEVSLMACQEEELIVPIYRPETTSQSELSHLFCFYLVAFYGPNVPPTKDGIRMTISLFASLDGNMTDTMLNAALKKKGYTVKLEQYDDMRGYGRAMRSLITYCNIVEEQKAIIKKFVGVPGALAAATVCLQTFGKYVTTESLTQWFKNRYLSIGRLLNVQNVQNAGDLVPQLNNMQFMYNILSSSFELRRLLVLRMFAFSDTDSIMGTMFEHVMSMLAGTDITHVFSIDTYVVRFMPEVLNLPILRNNEVYLVGMYEFWNKHRAIFPYVRFLIPPDQCTPINRNTLMQLTAAAVAIGAKVSDSYKNYRGAAITSRMYKQVHEAVERYFVERFRASHIGLIASERSTMTHEEHIEMMARQEERVQEMGDAEMIREFETLNVQGKERKD